MGWWPAFDRGEVGADFARIAAAGFDSVRLFLLWEHFQPRPDSVDARMLDRLVATLELAGDAGLSVMPTLFTGHMSGVNWVPRWALGGAEGDPRFRVVSDGRVVERGIQNWYVSPKLAKAQAFLARAVGRALAGHSALWAWDLGNEGSNCVRPPTRAHGTDWLTRMTDALRESGEATPITIGLHMEDLAEDRRMGPAEAAGVCDFLTMHGYPAYAPWSRGPTDEALLPFLAEITRWLGGGIDVVFSELGAPTFRAGDPGAEHAREISATALVEETDAAAYVERALPALFDCGCAGAMLWCHSDYAPATWDAPPLDAAIHERSFGQWRADDSPKPAVAAVEAFVARVARCGPGRSAPPSASIAPSWIDIARDDYFQGVESRLPRLYGRYLDATGLSAR
jgi:endo-1,4-beta-mannosidase